MNHLQFIQKPEYNFVLYLSLIVIIINIIVIIMAIEFSVKCNTPAPYSVKADDRLRYLNN